MEKLNVKRNNQDKPTSSIVTLLSNRFSSVILAAYVFLACGVGISISLSSLSGAAACALIAGALILVVQLDARIRLLNSRARANEELRAIRWHVTSTHKYLVRVEDRAKFRYRRLSTILTGIHSNLQTLVSLSKKLGDDQGEGLNTVYSETSLLRSKLDELGGLVTSAPVPVTEEIFKKRFIAHSSRLTQRIEETLVEHAAKTERVQTNDREATLSAVLSALEDHEVSAKTARDFEVDAVRNVVWSALAIQRAELDILAGKLLEGSLALRSPDRVDDPNDTSISGVSRAKS